MNQRYLGLDLTRAVLMLLGVILHSAAVFSTSISARVETSEHHYFFNFIVSFIQSFRMQGFLPYFSFFLCNDGAKVWY